MRSYRKYTDEEIVIAAKKVKSIAGLLRELNLREAGGNYGSIKQNIQRLKIDTSHWTGSAWNKGEQLKDWSQYKNPERIKINLIKEKGHNCENCYLSKWIEGPIPLDLHHLDGDRTNNKKENFQLLCCNCHALTKTWKGRKNKILP